MYNDEANKFYEDGYCIVDLGLDDSSINILKNDVLQCSKKQESGYHYSDGPRVFEAWKTSENVRALANNEKVSGLLEYFFQRKCFPFQTINFISPSNQPLHSDDIHFSTIPKGFVAACWVALEDVDESNGTLRYVPKSHKLPYVDFKTIGLNHTKYGEQFDNYYQYEKYIEQLVVDEGLEIKSLNVKKGTALIWAGNLIHGGTPISEDCDLTRWSQATHYYFDGCEHYYCPMFSDPSKEIYSEKNLKEKNIRGDI